MEATMQVHSPAFFENGMIPRQYTCDAANVSPTLYWSGWPTQTQSFALVCEDPDAPKGTFTHWVAWNIPTHTPEMPERVAHEGRMPNGAVQGTNDFGKLGYGGPCPPPGSTHRYQFKIYALDSMLPLDVGANSQLLYAAMAGHVLGEGQLTAKYHREPQAAAH